jgi:hypothetical protein
MLQWLVPVQELSRWQLVRVSDGHRRLRVLLGRVQGQGLWQKEEINIFAFGFSEDSDRCILPAGALAVSFADGSADAAGAVAGAGSSGFVGVGADASVFVGGGGAAEEESVSVG